MNRYFLLSFLALTLILGLTACGPAATAEPSATLPAPTETRAPTDTPVPTDTPAPTSTSTETPAPTDTPEPTSTPTETPIPLEPLALLSRNMTLLMPPGWRVDADTEDYTALFNDEEYLILSVFRVKQASPADLTDNTRALLKQIYQDPSMNFSSHYETSIAPSLTTTGGLEVRQMRFLFPDDVIAVSGEPRGKPAVWYYYLHEGAYGYTLVFIAGEEDMARAEAEITGIVTSAQPGAEE